MESSSTCKEMTSSTIGAVFVVSGLLEIIIPLALGFYITSRFGTSWRTWLVGGTMFIVSLIRVPLNSYLLQLVLSAPTSPLIYSLFVIIPSITAGIFEEVARFVGLRFLIKDESYEKGLAYGAGHGGIESILVVGLNVLSVGVILLTNPEALPPLQLNAIIATPAYLPLVGIYERIMAIIIQISFSIMVLQSIRRKNFNYLIIAIGIHAILDYLAVSLLNYGILYSEVMITGFALGLGFWSYNRLKEEEIID